MVTNWLLNIRQLELFTHEISKILNFRSRCIFILHRDCVKEDIKKFPERTLKLGANAENGHQGKCQVHKQSEGSEREKKLYPHFP